MNPKTFSDWAALLHDILDTARDAVASGRDIAPVHARLKRFMVDSDDTLDGVAELDEVARQAMRDLVVAEIDGSVEEIAGLSADVASLEKKFSTLGSTNNSIAAGLRLERMQAVLASSTQTIASLKALADTLPTATDKDAQKIAAQIADVIDALTKLASALPRKV